MTKILMCAAAAMLLTTFASDAGPATPKNGDRCASIQAKCAIQSGGHCDAKTGRWHVGGVGQYGGAAGGSVDGWQDCIDKIHASGNGKK